MHNFTCAKATHCHRMTSFVAIYSDGITCADACEAFRRDKKQR
jgi:hypothetical protein